jgi:hypothetical protein
MRRASNGMGFGDDWKKALEKVKNMYVERGKQPQLIRDLEHEAETFVTHRGLVTIPSLASETWRMRMMTPERQLINPFFTGGDTISVSYPTEDMTYEQKMMSMRGNNIPFSRATVFHELIPVTNCSCSWRAATTLIAEASAQHRSPSKAGRSIGSSACGT